MDGYPSDAEEGESLYHVTEDAAYVYTGSSWVEQTVTNHSQLAGVSEGDHRTESQVQQAVDGSSITVQNAEQLGGQAPSAFETPDTTATTGEGGGIVNEETVLADGEFSVPQESTETYSGTEYPSKPGVVVDEVRLRIYADLQTPSEGSFDANAEVFANGSSQGSVSISNGSGEASASTIYFSADESFDDLRVEWSFTGTNTRQYDPNPVRYNVKFTRHNRVSLMDHSHPL
jgi:hypothetical protein